MVRLERLDLDAQFLRRGLEGGIDVGQGLRPVDVRLPAPEQVQVRPVENENLVADRVIVALLSNRPVTDDRGLALARGGEAPLRVRRERRLRIGG